MDQLKLEAAPREAGPKRANGRLRREGRIPAVIYGRGVEPAMISVDNHTVELILKGARTTNKVFHLQGPAGDEATLAREIQRHPVDERLLHIDFQRIDLEQVVEVEVPLRVVGADPAGVRAGGILEHLMRQVTIRSKPNDIPVHLDADLSALEMNQTFHLSDLTVPANVEVLDDLETPLFSILPPRTEVEAETEEEAGAAEPELIRERQEDEE